MWSRLSGEGTLVQKASAQTGAIAAGVAGFRDTHCHNRVHKELRRFSSLRLLLSPDRD